MREQGMGVIQVVSLIPFGFQSLLAVLSFLKIKNDKLSETDDYGTFVELSHYYNRRKK